MRIEIKPPMVLSVAKEINEPRYITLMNILEAEKKETQIWSYQDLSSLLNNCKRLPYIPH